MNKLILAATFLLISKTSLFCELIPITIENDQEESLTVYLEKSKVLESADLLITSEHEYFDDYSGFIDGAKQSVKKVFESPYIFSCREAGCATCEHQNCCDLCKSIMYNPEVTLHEDINEVKTFTVRFKDHEEYYVIKSSDKKAIRCSGTLQRDDMIYLFQNLEDKVNNRPFWYRLIYS